MVNERKFSSIFRSRYGNLYGRALELFRSFGGQLSDPLVRILLTPNPEWRGQVKRTIALLEKIKDRLAIIMDAPMSPSEKIKLLKSLLKAVDEIIEKLPEKNCKGKNGTNVLISGNEDSIRVPLADGKGENN